MTAASFVKEKRRRLFRLKFWPGGGTLHREPCGQAGRRARGGVVFGLGMPELLVILLIALVVFGAAKLPQIGSSLGTAIREFKRSIESPPKEMPPTPSSEIACSQCKQPLQPTWVACPRCGARIDPTPGR
jgi:sec-independent protein translocase protein TatA